MHNPNSIVGDLGGGSLELIDVTRMTTARENEFLASLLAWERAPMLPIRQWFHPPLDVPLIKAGLLHQGFAFIDVISPCVAFNNHPGSTKSYDYVRGHRSDVVSANFVPVHEEITADYAPGTREDVAMPDGSTLRMRKLAEDYDPRDRVAALAYVQRKREEGEVVTGLLYLDPDASDCHAILETVDTPLNAVTEADLCPGSAALAGVNASFR